MALQAAIPVTLSIIWSNFRDFQQRSHSDATLTRTEFLTTRFQFLLQKRQRVARCNQIDYLVAELVGPHAGILRSNLFDEIHAEAVKHRGTQTPRGGVAQFTWATLSYRPMEGQLSQALHSRMSRLNFCAAFTLCW